jgi:hypothetical protein
LPFIIFLPGSVVSFSTMLILSSFKRCYNLYKGKLDSWGD